MVAAATITTPLLTLNPDLPDVWDRCPPTQILNPDTMEYRRLSQIRVHRPKFPYIDPSNLERVRVPEDHRVSNRNHRNPTNEKTAPTTPLKRKASSELMGHINTQPVFIRDPPASWTAVRPEQVRPVARALQNTLGSLPHDEGLGMSASPAPPGDTELLTATSISQLVSPITPEGTPKPKPSLKRKEISSSQKTLRLSKKTKASVEEKALPQRITRSEARKQGLKE